MGERVAYVLGGKWGQCLPFCPHLWGKVYYHSCPRKPSRLDASSPSNSEKADGTPEFCQVHRQCPSGVLGDTKASKPKIQEVALVSWIKRTKIGSQTWIWIPALPITHTFKLPLPRFLHPHYGDYLFLLETVGPRSIQFSQYLALPSLCPVMVRA